MKAFYSCCFHLVNKVMKRKDDKIHKHNKFIDGIKISTVNYVGDKSKYHLMDFYQNDSSVKGIKQPLILQCHGGGYFYGTKDTYIYFNNWLASQNYVVAAPSYTLLFKAGLQQMMQEIFQAFSIAISNIDKLNVDKNKIYLTGDSVGSNLALLFLAINQSNELQKIYGVKHLDVDIKKVFLNNPVCYAERIPMMPKKPHFDKKAHEWFMSKLCGIDYRVPNDIYDTNSIDKYIKYLNKLPSTFVTTSTGDGFNALSKEVYQLLKNKGFDVSINDLQDKTYGHVYNILVPIDDKRSVDINNKIVSFLNN